MVIKQKLKKQYKEKITLKILIKTIAVFFASALSVLGAGSVVGVGALKSAYMAGLLGLVRVGESLAKAFLDDGKLSMTEVDDAFKNADQKPQ